MRARTMSLRSIGLSFLYLLLLSFSITLLAGCGPNPAVGTVDSWQDPPEVKASQATVNQNPKVPPAVVIPVKPEIDNAAPMPEVVERVGGC